MNFKKTRPYSGPHNYREESSIFYFTFDPSTVSSLFHEDAGGSCPWRTAEIYRIANCCPLTSQLIENLAWKDSENIMTWMESHLDPATQETPLCYFSRIRTIAYLSSVLFNIGLFLKAILFLRYYRLEV